MLALVRKDCLWFLLITGGFLSSAVFYLLGSVDGGDTDSRIVFQIGLLQLGLVGFSLFSSELRESYRFLQTLPITATEVVASKFFLVFTQVALYWCLVLVLLSNADWSSSDLSFAVGVINACAILSLLLAACAYWAIFRFGFSLASKILLVLCFVALIGVILLAEVLEDRLVVWRLASLSTVEWIVPIILGFLVYFLMMRLAIRAKITGEVDR